MKRALLITLAMSVTVGCPEPTEDCELECLTESVLVRTELECEMITLDYRRTDFAPAQGWTVRRECSQETHCQTVPFTMMETTCVEAPQLHSGTVCGEEQYTHSQVECSAVNSEEAGETCQDLMQTHHRVIDFDQDAKGRPILPGSWGSTVETAWEDWGVTISIENYDGSPTSHGLAVFDSSYPTGGDSDLETPFNVVTGAGGPSYDWEGQYTNFFDRGNLLIHAENLVDADADGLLDDPDDERWGGRFTFHFDHDVCFHSLDLIDVQLSEAGYLTAFDASGTVVLDQPIWGLGDNSVQVVDPGVEGMCGVRTVVYEMCGSGAVDNLRFSAEELTQVCMPYEHTCLEDSCTQVQTTESVSVCSDWETTCQETTCTQSEVIRYQEVCVEDEDCYDVLTPAEEEESACLTEVEVCHEVRYYHDVTTCDETSCDAEWVEGGGFLGAN